MKIRRGAYEVFSLSAVDLFASAMGAFVLLSIMLMPDYGKKGDPDQPAPVVQPAKPVPSVTLEQAAARRTAAETVNAQLLAKLASLQREASALRQKLAENVPNPPPQAAPTETETANAEAAAFEAAARRVSFRFLGMKTNKNRLLLMVDMSRFLDQQHPLILQTVTRILESLQDNHEFAVMGFQHTGGRTAYFPWPADSALVAATPQNKARAQRFVKDLKGKFQGSAPLLDAIKAAQATEAEAVFLLSDGFPNPAANQNLQLAALADAVTRANSMRKEIHAVTLGEYFRYAGATQFMERIARQNDGDFMAIAP